MKLSLCSSLLALLSLAAFPTATQAQILSEDFNTVLPAGWTNTNNSTTQGTNPTWFQGNPGVFNAHQGATNAYAAANFNATTGNNTISLWMITPSFTVSNGDSLSFFTRTVTTPSFADRLQVRFNPLNTTNVGATDTSVGDFTTLMVTVNPTLTLAGYPNDWTNFAAAFTGLAGPTTGRLAFRYFVTSGGPSGANSDYIGVDTLRITASSSAPEPGTLALLALGSVAVLAVRKRRH